MPVSLRKNDNLYKVNLLTYNLEGQGLAIILDVILFNVLFQLIESVSGRLCLLFSIYYYCMEFSHIDK